MNVEKFWAVVKAVLSKKDEIKAVGETTGQTLETIFELIQNVVTAYAMLTSESRGRGQTTPIVTEILAAYDAGETDHA